MSQPASSDNQDPQDQAAAVAQAMARYPALASKTANPPISAEESAKIARATPLARPAGAPIVGRVVIDDPAVRARVVTNGATICLWITYPDKSGSLGCGPANGESFGAADLIANGQLRFTGVVDDHGQASVNGKPVVATSGAFTQLVSPGDRIEMGAVSQVVREP